MSIKDNWTIASYMPSIVEFEKQQGINRYVAQILANRGIDKPYDMLRWIQAEEWMLGDPFRIINMTRAVGVILRALKEQERICVYGDYDADGICSSAILYTALRNLAQDKERISAYIPNRFNERRGLHNDAIDKLHSQGVQLIVTVDCGTSDVEAVEHAKFIGVNVIITDHHEAPARLPKTTIINPIAFSDNSPDIRLCGSGIAYKIAQALSICSGIPLADEEYLLSLATIGTIADVFPLIGDNHIIARRGLRMLSETCHIGLRALLDVAGIYSGSNVSVRAVGFFIAPRINAACRMSDPMLGLRLLTTQDKDEAEDLACKLDTLNKDRQEETEELFSQADEQAQKQLHLPIIMVFGEKWHPGIVGLVAGRITSKYNRPSAVGNIDDKRCHASLRSVDGFSIIDALRCFEKEYLHVGGHAGAAGFAIEMHHAEELHKHLVDEWYKQYPIWPAEGPKSTAKSIDIELKHPNVLSQKKDGQNIFLQAMYSAGPFGKGFAEPVYLVRNVLIDRATYTRYGGIFLDISSSDGNWCGTAKVSDANSVTYLETGMRVDVVFNLETSKDSEEPLMRVLDIEKN